MASTFVLKNLDHRNLTACLGDRPGLDPDALRAYTTLLRVAGAILEATETQLARHGISQGRLRLLIQLRLEGEHGLAPWVLAERLGISRATVTRFLDCLERDGLVERTPSPRDGRSLVVRLSPKGGELVKALLPQRVARIRKLMAGLKPAEKSALVGLLELVEAGLGRFSEDA